MGRDSSPLNMLNSSIINSSTPSPPIGVAYYCDIHRDAHKFYCQTCNKLLCDDCGKHHHRGHTTVHLMEAIEGAGIQANQVLKEAKLGITALKEDLDAVQVTSCFSITKLNIFLSNNNYHFMLSKIFNCRRLPRLLRTRRVKQQRMLWYICDD